MKGERSLFMAMYQIDKTKATKFYQNKKERRRREKVASLSSWARLGASETTFGTL
jgi:predicted transposase YdaD